VGIFTIEASANLPSLERDLMKDSAAFVSSLAPSIPSANMLYIMRREIPITVYSMLFKNLPRRKLMALVAGVSSSRGLELKCYGILKAGHQKR
jgi:hypothetical protein